MLCPALAQVVEHTAPTPPPLKLVSSKILPGENFRMLVDLVVTAADGATVNEVDGVCVTTVDNLRRDEPAARVVRDGANWFVEFNVPKNTEYYVEIYSLTPGPAPAKGKKPKKVKSVPLLVQVRV